MRRSRFTEEQIVGILKEQEAGVPTAQLCRRLRVVRVLEELVRERGLPRTILMDNRPKLTSWALDPWADDHGGELRFIDPGKPIQNAFIESINGRFREECLNQHWFENLAQVRRVVAAWRLDNNRARPHSALSYLTPDEFAIQIRATQSQFATAGSKL